MSTLPDPKARYQIQVETAKRVGRLVIWAKENGVPPYDLINTIMTRELLGETNAKQFLDSYESLERLLEAYKPKYQSVIE